jgi:hypothetical protein
MSLFGAWGAQRYKRFEKEPEIFKNIWKVVVL